MYVIGKCLETSTMKSKYAFREESESEAREEMMPKQGLLHRNENKFNFDLLKQIVDNVGRGLSNSNQKTAKM